MTERPRVALVTGATSGLGRAVATVFASRGMQVVAMARRAEAGAALEAEVAAAGGSLVFVRGDVRASADCDAAVERALSEFGRLDVLVNNAGVEGVVTEFHRLSDDEWLDVVDTNLNGYFRCARAALRVMVDQGAGLVVNISSINGSPGCAIAHMAPYNTAKAAIRQLTDTLAVEYLPFGIRVNSIVLGSVRTDMNQRSVDGMSTFVRGGAAAPTDDANPLAGALMMEPDDVARFLALLCEDDARLLTGATIAVDRAVSAGLIGSAAVHMAYQQ